MRQIFVLGQKNSGIKEIGDHIRGWGVKEIVMDDVSKEMLQYIQENTSSKSYVTFAKLEKQFADIIKKKLKGDFFVADDWSIKTHRIYKRYCNPLHIIVFRNSVDLARQLDEVIGNFEQALEVVLQEDSMLVEAIKLLEEDRIYVSYDEYVKDKEKVLNNIKKFLQIEES